MPSRGEIWYSKMQTDPPGKAARPVIIVSEDFRNRAPRAQTVLVVPLSTTPKKTPYHVELPPGETGLGEWSFAKPENITTLLKTDLEPPRHPLRRLGESRLRQIAAGVQAALGFAPLRST